MLVTLKYYCLVCLEHPPYKNLCKSQKDIWLRKWIDLLGMPVHFFILFISRSWWIITPALCDVPACVTAVVHKQGDIRQVCLRGPGRSVWQDATAHTQHNAIFYISPDSIHLMHRSTGNYLTPGYWIIGDLSRGYWKVHFT